MTVAGFFMLIGSIVLLSFVSFLEGMSYRDVAVGGAVLGLTIPVFYIVGFVAWTALIERQY